MIKAQEPVRPNKRAKKGHNSKVKAAPANNDRLKSFADRIDRLEEEKKALSGDVKDVYTEVKSAGYNPKALRKVLADRRRKSDDELAADMETYRAALGVPGATYRAVAEQLGVTKSKLQRLVPRNQNGTETAHDPATGEIKEEGCLSGRDAPSDEHSEADDDGRSSVETGGNDEPAGSGDRADDEREHAAGPACASPRPAEPESGAGISGSELASGDGRPVLLAPTQDIDITLPKFLDRRVSP